MAETTKRTRTFPPIALKFRLDNGDLSPVPDVGLFEAEAEARKWVRDNGKDGVTYYPVRVYPPIKVTQETVRKVV